VHTPLETNHADLRGDPVQKMSYGTVTLMRWESLPATAAWRHHNARDAFEVLFTESHHRGFVLRGATTGVEDGRAWSMDYRVTTNTAWITTSLQACLRDQEGARSVALKRTPDNGWLVNGVHDSALDGCYDVDLECSVVTNTLPVHRLELSGVVSVPAAFVRVTGGPLVMRLEQTYGAPSSPDHEGLHTVPYTSATFDLATSLTYDKSGLIINYPGLARRQI